METPCHARRRRERAQPGHHRLASRWYVVQGFQTRRVHQIYHASILQTDAVSVVSKDGKLKHCSLPRVAFDPISQPQSVDVATCLVLAQSIRIFEGDLRTNKRRVRPPKVFEEQQIAMLRDENKKENQVDVFSSQGDIII